MLITLEGIDGTGKSTLHAGLAEALSEYNPVMTREPGSTWIGEMVRRAIAEDRDPIAEALLFVADHAAHLSSVVRPALQDERLVISDRYLDSRYAYQQVSLATHIPSPKTWLTAVHEGWTIIPDKTFLLVIPVEGALRRSQKRGSRDHFEQEQVLRQVQQNYLERAEAEPSRFVIIDATLAPEEILQFVAGEIRRLYATHSQKKVKPSRSS